MFLTNPVIVLVLFNLPWNYLSTNSENGEFHILMPFTAPSSRLSEFPRSFHCLSFCASYSLRGNSRSWNIYLYTGLNLGLPCTPSWGIVHLFRWIAWLQPSSHAGEYTYDQVFTTVKAMSGIMSHVAYCSSRGKEVVIVIVLCSINIIHLISGRWKGPAALKVTLCTILHADTCRA